LLFFGAGLFLWTGCATCERGPARKFEVGRDAFAFTNELKWVYAADAQGEMQGKERETPPDYIHHCFPMVRAAREFFYHADFEPQNERADASAYKKLVEQVVGRDSRCPADAENKVHIPGFANLREFSMAYPALLQKGCGRQRDSYFQRGNWRMVFPFSRGGQEKIARGLEGKLRSGLLPVIHITNFPKHTINHAVLVFDVEEMGEGLSFSGYDPNNPSRPAKLIYNRGNKSFEFEQNEYFAGGRVNVYEVYRNAFY
jgi:hypothetical protein